LKSTESFFKGAVEDVLDSEGVAKILAERFDHLLGSLPSLVR